jgi:lambda repressor-like predicted transcriptional regulator
VHGPETSRTDNTELAALRDAFPGYRFRRRFVRGVLCYLAEARASQSPAPKPPKVAGAPAVPEAPDPDVRGAGSRGPQARGVDVRGAAAPDAPLAAARSPAVLADMLAVAAGRPVRLRPAAVAAAYRDRRMSMQQCAVMFGVSRTTIMKFLAAEGVTPRSPGRALDEPAMAAAYRDGLSLRECAARWGISERRVATVLERQGVPRRPVGRPPRRAADP